ncbi:MAG: GNAT family N-acetyltransferase [Paludibacter sp.]|nr:GNAT family N-acetyltransferase [Paludibacter sp.]
MFTEIENKPYFLANKLVKLRLLVEDDFENLYRIASDPLIWEQHPEKERYKKEVFIEFFDSALIQKTAFVIIDNKTNKIIGSTRYYDFQPDNLSITIGFTFLSRKYWGGLYNYSIKKTMIEYAFRYVDRIYFYIGIYNIRSQKAIERIGAVKISEINFKNSDISKIQYEYLIQKKDWII